MEFITNIALNFDRDCHYSRCNDSEVLKIFFRLTFSKFCEQLRTLIECFRTSWFIRIENFGILDTNESV